MSFEPRSSSRSSLVSRPSYRRGAAWLLAGLFLLTQVAALAHEYDHVLHKHEVPCAQHSFASGLDAACTAHALPAAAPPVAAAAICLPSHDLPSRPAAAYAVRAPPRLA